ncbi:hypothetical protein ACFXPX_36770 [Kitasatospora sp. NPDC059146]|uniref:hypothetical protein n=1 Tax=unclassified Kitasatospora TaxID=2633591 RepID=UPI0036A2240E
MTGPSRRARAARQPGQATGRPNPHPQFSEEGEQKSKTTTPGGGGSTAQAFVAHPGAPRWYVRETARIMALRERAPADEGADGWHLAAWDDGVAVQRIQDGRHYLRPGRAGAARDRWDEAIRADRAHLAAHGLEIVLPGSPQTVVRVPEPARPQTTARPRRSGSAEFEPEPTSWSVTFDGHPGAGGYVSLRSTYASAQYKVVDHRWVDVQVGDADRRQSITLLAHHYGLPTPVLVVRES